MKTIMKKSSSFWSGRDIEESGKITWMCCLVLFSYQGISSCLIYTTEHLSNIIFYFLNETSKLSSISFIKWWFLSSAIKSKQLNSN